MTDEKMAKEVKDIIKKHLNAMVVEIEWKLLCSTDNYAEIVYKYFEDKLFQCFQPLIQVKAKIDKEIKEK